ncbi:hypothetical protein K0M31_018670 [Melipona bicolor]|uniref:Uncharacterized protein n=1 Tax=Melipona bicolor TaxID=60889 RepID=A0AA40G4H4_9HYME|nr:hypothetical protein K0M31_018670 [Melipona bicolor]
MTDISEIGNNCYSDFASAVNSKGNLLRVFLKAVYFSNNRRVNCSPIKTSSNEEVSRLLDFDYTSTKLPKLSRGRSTPSQ